MNKRSLYESTYSFDDNIINLEKNDNSIISSEEIPESSENFDKYDEAISIAEQLAQSYNGNIDTYAEKNHPEILDMYDDNMTPGEKLIQHIASGNI
jgi:tRNA splicing endonuclease